MVLVCGPRLQMRWQAQRVLQGAQQLLFSAARAVAGAAGAVVVSVAVDHVARAPAVHVVLCTATEGIVSAGFTLSPAAG